MTQTRMRPETANTEEQFQAVGMLCRETLISPAHAVYDAKIHGTLDEVQASSTDAMRMREEYIVEALAGSANNSSESMPEPPATSPCIRNAEEPPHFVMRPPILRPPLQW